MKSMLECALWYANKRHWPVLPLWPGKKTPMTTHGLLEATTNPAQINEWWAATPNAGIGVRTGTAAGVVVLDVDPRNGGDKSLAVMEEEHGKLPPTLTSMTGGGGNHYIFYVRGEAFKKCEIAPGIEIQGENHYVVLPPSIHPSGKRYEWEDPRMGISDIPTWLRKLILEGGKQQANGNSMPVGKVGRGGRHAFLRAQAVRYRTRSGDDAETVFRKLQVDYELRCEHEPPMEESELRGLADSAAAKFASAPEPDYSIASRREDTSNAERFASRFASVTRYSRPTKRWLTWLETQWIDNAGNYAIEMAKTTARGIYQECVEMTDGKERAATAKWAETSLNHSRIAAMLELAKTDPRIHIDNFADIFDCNPWLINFTNGTFDVSTGELREHRITDFITKKVHHHYIPGANAPTWERVVQETFGELVTFAQTAAGYSMTGDVSEKCVLLLIGPTNTGKTTYLSTLQDIFSEYSAKLQIDTLMQTRREDCNVLADLADLCGARFVITSETEEGTRLREAKLKRISQGMGTIKTARKYEHPFEFRETHKLWIDCNHRPIISGTDNAIWERLVCIPCTHPVQNPDRELKSKLLAEAEGIIQWVITGALRWKAEGLNIPEVVRAARNDWRETMDRIGEWLEECCTITTTAWSPTATLYASYKAWCENNHLEPLSQIGFVMRLLDRGFNQVRQRTENGQKRGISRLQLRQL
jgi:putative DNA primase/helicase